MGVRAEWCDALEPAGSIQAHRGELLVAHFKHEATVAQANRLAFEVPQQRASQASAAMVSMDIQSSKLGRRLAERAQGTTGTRLIMDVGDNVNAALNQRSVRGRLACAGKQLRIQGTSIDRRLVQQRKSVSTLRIDVCDHEVQPGASRLT